MEAEAQRVYDALLSSKYFYKGPDRTVWVIKTETRRDLARMHTKTRRPGFRRLAGHKRLRKGKPSSEVTRSSICLERSGRGCARTEPQDSMDDETAWKLFHETYPDSPARSRFLLSASMSDGIEHWSEPRLNVVFCAAGFDFMR